jgi:hypothetical protein
MSLDQGAGLGFSFIELNLVLSIHEDATQEADHGEYNCGDYVGHDLMIWL